MEGAPQNKIEKSQEYVDYRESIEQAKEIYAELISYKGTDIIGKDGLDRVEALSHALSIELSEIPPAIRMVEGLPYHPYENVINAKAVNDDDYSAVEALAA